MDGFELSTMNLNFGGHLDCGTLFLVNCFVMNLCCCAGLCCPLSNQVDNREYLKNKKYVYIHELYDVTNISKTGDFTTTSFNVFKGEEFFDCELSDEDKAIISQIKTAMAHKNEDDRRNAVRELMKTSPREIRFDGYRSVEFSLSGPEKPKLAAVDRSSHHVRNALFYDVTEDRVFGYGVPSAYEAAKFQEVVTALNGTALANNWCCFGQIMCMGTTLHHCFTACCIYECLYGSEIDKIISDLPRGMDMVIDENRMFGKVYLRMHVHDYTQYGPTHNSGVSAQEVPVVGAATAAVVPTTQLSASVAPFSMER